MSRKQTPDIMADLMSEKSCPIEPIDVEVHHKEIQPKQSKTAAAVIEQEHTFERAHKTNTPQKKSVKQGLPVGWTRATFILREDLNEKIKAIAYWDRLTVKEVMHDALMQYMKDRHVKSVPKKRSVID